MDSLLEFLIMIIAAVLWLVAQAGGMKKKRGLTTVPKPADAPVGNESDQMQEWTEAVRQLYPERYIVEEETEEEVAEPVVKVPVSASRSSAIPAVAPSAAEIGMVPPARMTPFDLRKGDAEARHRILRISANSSMKSTKVLSIRIAPVMMPSMFSSYRKGGRIGDAVRHEIKNTRFLKKSIIAKSVLGPCKAMEPPM